MSTNTSIARMQPISADSHIVEPPDLFTTRIDPKYRESAPHVVTDGTKGDFYVIPGMERMSRFSIAGVAGAGVPAQERRAEGRRFADIHRGSWDPKARLIDMDRDGVAAEIIYPTAGMVIFSHPDADYQNACFRAYNQWLQEFIAGAPTRLFGIGTSAARSVAELIEDMHRIKEMGFKGVMLPDVPPGEDYESLSYDPAWRAAVELDLPISFHILAASAKGPSPMHGRPRGGKLNGFLGIIRGNQDIIGMFIFSGIFDRHPRLKLVCVEADAGWALHFMTRMDHGYDVHRHWLEVPELSRRPSEFFRENVYLTFQDDVSAFLTAKMGNPERYMWASDYPHSDSTWPLSQQVLLEQTAHLDAPTICQIVHDNVATLYKLPLQ